MSRCWRVCACCLALAAVLTTAVLVQPIHVTTTPAPGPFAALLDKAAPQCHIEEDSGARGTLFDGLGEQAESAQREPEPSPEFLSFEEWRTKSEEAARRAAELGREGETEAAEDSSQRPPSTETSTTDSQAEGAPQEPSSVGQEGTEVALPTSMPLTHPNQHAGTGSALDPLPSLKSRANYASFDCAATIQRSSPSSRSPSSILSEKKDRYMLTPCSAKDKHVVIELCDEIEIDTVVIANFEFFSSMFKFVRMQVSSGLEGDDSEWVDAGTFRARNVRGLQVFPITNLKGFYRHVRLDFLTHYGAEYYCPVSLVRVYGLTQIDAYRRDQERERRRQTAATSVVVATRVVANSGEPKPEQVPADSGATHMSRSPTVGRSEEASSPHGASSVVATTSNSSIAVSYPRSNKAPVSSTPVSPQSDSIPPTSLPESSKRTTPASAPASHTSINGTITGADSSLSEASSTSPKVSIHVAQSPNVSTVASASSSAASVSEETVISKSTYTPPPPSSSIISSPVPPPSPKNHNSPQTRDNPNESIYGTIMKRLKALEANQSLANQYVEDQGKLLRGAFARVDRRLEEFDARTIRQENLLRQILRDFEAHQVASERDRQALAEEVTALAEGLILGKRLLFGQVCALLVVIVFVGLTRGAPSIPQGLQLIHTPRASVRGQFAELKGVRPPGEHRVRKGSSYVFEARAGSNSPETGGGGSPRLDRFFNVSRTASLKRSKASPHARRTAVDVPSREREVRVFGGGQPKPGKYKVRSQTPPPRLQELARTLPATSSPATRRLAQPADRSPRGKATAPPDPTHPSSVEDVWSGLTIPTVRSPAPLDGLLPERMAAPADARPHRQQSSTSQWGDWTTEGSQTASSVATESEREDDEALDTPDVRSPTLGESLSTIGDHHSGADGYARIPPCSPMNVKGKTGAGNEADEDPLLHNDRPTDSYFAAKGADEGAFAPERVREMTPRISSPVSAFFSPSALSKTRPPSAGAAHEKGAIVV